MLKKQFNYVTMALTGVFFCVLGCSFVVESLTVWNWLYTTLVIGISAVAILKLINLLINFRRIEKRFSQLLDIIIWCIAIIFSLALPRAFYSILPRIVGSWILLHAIVKKMCIRDRRWSTGVQGFT